MHFTLAEMIRIPTRSTNMALIVDKTSTNNEDHRPNLTENTPRFSPVDLYIHIALLCTVDKAYGGCCASCLQNTIKLLRQAGLESMLSAFRAECQPITPPALFDRAQHATETSLMLRSTE